MTDLKAPIERPLSPHLQIYRFTWTMAMSIVHRITGSALYAGTAVLAIWLIAVAGGRSSFETAQWFMGSIVGRLILIGYTWALFHHMLGGMRHFVWDTGLGYGPNIRQSLAKFTLVGSIALTVIVWALVLFLR